MSMIYHKPEVAKDEFQTWIQQGYEIFKHASMFQDVWTVPHFEGSTHQDAILWILKGLEYMPFWKNKENYEYAEKYNVSDYKKYRFYTDETDNRDYVALSVLPVSSDDGYHLVKIVKKAEGYILNTQRILTNVSWRNVMIHWMEQVISGQKTSFENHHLLNWIESFAIDSRHQMHEPLSQLTTDLTSELFIRFPEVRHIANLEEAKPESYTLKQLAKWAQLLKHPRIDSLDISVDMNP